MFIHKLFYILQYSETKLQFLRMFQMNVELYSMRTETISSYRNQPHFIPNQYNGFLK